MSTHALVFVYEQEYDTPISTRARRLLCFYRQMDGYPSGLGSELYRFLEKGRLVNGLSLEDYKKKGKVFNGAGCLAAQLVAHFKEGPGGVYIMPVTSPSEEWNYHLYVYPDGPKTGIEVRVTHNRKPAFFGPLSKFGQWVKSYEK